MLELKLVEIKKPDRSKHYHRAEPLYKDSRGPL